MVETLVNFEKYNGFIMLNQRIHDQRYFYQNEQAHKSGNRTCNDAEVVRKWSL